MSPAQERVLAPVVCLSLILSVMFLVGVILVRLYVPAADPVLVELGPPPAAREFVSGDPWSAYAQNEATAERLYLNKEVEIAGNVMFVTKAAPGIFTASLVTNGLNVTVDCDFGEGADIHRLVAKQSYATIRGTVRTWTTWSQRLRLDECHVVKEHKPSELPPEGPARPASPIKRKRLSARTS